MGLELTGTLIGVRTARTKATEQNPAGKEYQILQVLVDDLVGGGKRVMQAFHYGSLRSWPLNETVKVPVWVSGYVGRDNQATIKIMTEREVPAHGDNGRGNGAPAGARRAV